jgi:hypothetical protein
MDVVSHKVVCKIQKIDSDDFTPKDNDTALVFEDEITYGMGCPVIINLEGKDFDGDIACIFRTPNGDGTMDVTYSVVTASATNQSKMVHGLNSHQVKYRRTDELLPETNNEEQISADLSVPDVVAISKDQESRSSSLQNPDAQLKWEPPTNEKKRAIADSESKLKSDSSHRDKRSRCQGMPSCLSLTLTVPSWVLKVARGSNSLVGKFLATSKLIGTATS